MILDSKIPEGPLSPTNTVRTHTGRRWVMGAICLFILLFSGCHCSDNSGAVSYPYLYVFKYVGEEDLSHHVEIVDNNQPLPIFLDSAECIPIKLHQNFFLNLSHSINYEYNKARLLTITIDDIIEGNAPNNWKENWENYVMDGNPYKTFYICPASLCKYSEFYYKDLPFYRDGSGEKGIDTNIINNMIDNGTLFEYLYKAI